MKTLIVLAMAFAVTLAAITLSEDGYYKFTINFSENSSNSSNTDVALGLIIPMTSAPMTSNFFTTGACVNVATSNYQLTTDSTALKGFGIEWRCHSTCASLAAVYNSVTFYGGSNWGQTADHIVSSGSLISVITSPAGLNSNNSTAKTVSYTFFGLTPTQLASTVYMPNQTETWYIRCFARFNNAFSASLNRGVVDLATTLGNARNLSLCQSLTSTSSSCTDLASSDYMPAFTTLAGAVSLCAFFL
ncbi:unnamed protein product [Moneuplotes crassus]|uniref:Uncharacterized protein n=1 Tax=Euplotes crassus TaxID=5936 RepID=A0AAD1UNZ0_EUPCR|nr:unnamed protein product [Moneuplotes crassus]